LAEAAAQGVRLIRDNQLSVPNALVNFINSGLIAKGESDELVARLLFLDAYDAIIGGKSAMAKEQSEFSQPIRVKHFLRQPFGMEHFKHIWSSHADSDFRCGRFSRVFKHAYVRFSNFARDHEQNRPSTYTALAALARGMAIQCSTDQDVIDIVIPVVLCKNIWEEKLYESKLTAILENRTGKQRVRIDEALINK